MPSPQVQPFFDEQTSTFSYVVYQAGDPSCAIIDSVLDYDPKSGRTATDSADEIIEFVRREKLAVQWILETHAHADHLSAAAHLKAVLGGRIAIGKHIMQVQASFKEIFNLKDDFAPDGRQFDHLFEDGETFMIGQMKASALHVPGHTPADLAYRIDGLGVFVGDTLFMPDLGTARCDFPGGDAHALYRSIRRILSLDESTALYLCHDYPPENRSRQCRSTVAEQRRHNIHVHDGINETEFVAMRTARDETLDMPVLILPAIQLNIRAGEPPTPEDNGVHYLKIPLNQL
ncbi:MBL fold metallo-hydrolase [Pollutimonas sp. H1-120]|uniref:MBL fold metallo-hydrolase n=1 Tax=Pollutimonas sp. H1-120 TaxID=3148824 RepID=UPI003B51EA6D